VGAPVESTEAPQSALREPRSSTFGDEQQSGSREQGESQGEPDEAEFPSVTNEPPAVAEVLLPRVEVELESLPCIQPANAQPPVLEGTDISSRLNDAWPRVIEAAGVRSKSLQGLLRGVQLKEVADSEVTLGFRYSFHREQSDKPENRATIQRIIQEIIGVRLRVRCIEIPAGATATQVDDVDTFIADAELMLRSVHAQQFRSSHPE